MGLLIRYIAGNGYRERERSSFIHQGFIWGRHWDSTPLPPPPKKCDIIITSTTIVEYKVHAV